MNNGIILVMGVTITGVAVGMQIVASQRDASITPTTLYIVLDSSSEPEPKIAKNALSQIQQKQPSYQRLIVDVMEGDGLSNIYSDEMGENAIKEIYRQVKIVPSSDKAFVQAIHRAGLLRAEEIPPDHRLHVLILSAGIEDQALLPAIQEEALSLSEYSNFTIYVVGLAAKDSLMLSSAFSSIPKHVEFSGQLPSELEIVIDQLGEDHK
jgi:hypothetical protein